jgi:hypothetical protein
MESSARQEEKFREKLLGESHSSIPREIGRDPSFTSILVEGHDLQLKSELHFYFSSISRMTD